jgi:hypothetical protein
MVKDNDCVAIFHNIHRVMKAEKQLKLAALDILLIPVPRQLSSDCGLAIRFNAELYPAVLGLLQQHGLLPVELYRKEGQRYERLALPLQQG